MNREKTFIIKARQCGLTNYSIDTKHVENFVESLKAKATEVKTNLQDWANWSFKGRIYVGQKRINVGYSQWWNDFNKRHLQLSTIEIVRRKIRRWLDKRK